MNEASSHLEFHRRHLSLLQKAAVLSSWAVAGAIFLTVGWLAFEPDDPQGAVSLLSRQHPALMWVQAMALGAVASAAATVIAGRTLTDVGTFAAAIGLAAVSVHGGTAAYLLWADNGTRAPGSLVGRLAVESMGWFLVILVALCVSALVLRWFHGSHRNFDIYGDEAPSLAPLPAGFDLPVVGHWLAGAEMLERTPPATGLKHASIAGLTAVVATGLLSAGLYSRSIQHGQSCFVVAAATWIGTRVACRFAPVRSVAWPILGLVIYTLGVYAWTDWRPADASAPANLPGSYYLRILPVQYIAVGAASAIATFWYAFTPELPPRPAASQRR